jgi:hypothetical protein
MIEQITKVTMDGSDLAKHEERTGYGQRLEMPGTSPKQ